jgi:hypothetical protein
MRSFKLWFRPAVFLGLWMSTMSYTLSELATVTPSLQWAASQPGRVRAEVRTTIVGARTQMVAR